MPESETTAFEIQKMRFKLEAIEATQVLLVRDRASSLLEDFLVLFREHVGLSLVYKAVDGLRTQADIVGYLESKSTPLSQPTVSRRMKTLVEHNLIEPVESGARGVIYEKNRVVEQVLGLSRKV